MMWFGHAPDNRSSVNGACPSLVICADIGQDHSRAPRACIRGPPPKDWRRRTGRPRQTWLRTVEDDLHSLNFGLATARRRTMEWIDRHGVYSWMRLRPRDTLQSRRVCVWSCASDTIILAYNLMFIQVGRRSLAIVIGDGVDITAQPQSVSPPSTASWTPSSPNQQPTAAVDPLYRRLLRVKRGAVRKLKTRR